MSLKISTLTTRPHWSGSIVTTRLSTLSTRNASTLDKMTLLSGFSMATNNHHNNYRHGQLDTLSLGLFMLVNHHYNYHYHYQHQYHGHNCPLVTSSFINILFKDRSCLLSSKSQPVPSSLLIIMIIVIIKIIIIVIMVRMLNPLVNLCENGFSASQIVSAIKVLFHRMHMYFKRDPQKKRKYSFSWSIFGLSSIFQTADQPILVQAVQIFQMLSN